MSRLGRAMTWLAAILAAPAMVAFAPVHPSEPVAWQPQIVAASTATIAPSGPVSTGSGASGTVMVRVWSIMTCRMFPPVDARHHRAAAA